LAAFKFWFTFWHPFAHTESALASWLALTSTTQSSLEAVNVFAYPKISIGAEFSVAAGPLGSGGAFDIGFADKTPAWVYTKSKGFYAGIALDATVVIERKDEYERRIKAAELINEAALRGDQAVQMG
jgi:lipid-binding SYLF domain-containing protein